MSNAVQPTPFFPGRTLHNGQTMNKVAAQLNLSSQDSITAHANGGKTNAFKLTASVSNITSVATAADSILLPPSSAGEIIIVINTGANAMQVYGAGTDTINGVATGTGISQPAGQLAIYACSVKGKWVSNGSGVFTTLSTTSSGTFAANGATPVTVANTGVTANSVIIPTLKTVGGTVGALPAIQTITPATGFTVAATASDTSTYNYIIIN